jgi:hypothetical protein
LKLEECLITIKIEGRVTISWTTSQEQDKTLMEEGEEIMACMGI